MVLYKTAKFSSSDTRTVKKQIIYFYTFTTENKIWFRFLFWYPLDKNITQILKTDVHFGFPWIPTIMAIC